MGRTLCLPAVALLAAALLAGCAAAEPADRASLATPAEPQQAQLEWRESYPSSGPRLVFGVERLEIRRLGWSVDVYIENTTDIPFTFPSSGPQAFGLMLFDNDDLDELSRAAQANALPALREARTYEPPAPSELRPGATWRATLSAPGSLAEGSYVRVSFGPLVAAGELPEGMHSPVVWITDHAHRI